MVMNRMFKKTSIGDLQHKDVYRFWGNISDPIIGIRKILRIYGYKVNTHSVNF